MTLSYVSILGSSSQPMRSTVTIDVCRSRFVILAFFFCRHATILPVGTHQTRFLLEYTVRFELITPNSAFLFQCNYTTHLDDL